MSLGEVTRKSFFGFLVVVPRSNIDNKKARTPSQHHRITLSYLDSSKNQRAKNRNRHPYLPTNYHNRKSQQQSYSNYSARRRATNDPSKSLRNTRSSRALRSIPSIPAFLVSSCGRRTRACLAAWLLASRRSALAQHTHTYIITSASLSLLVTYVPTLVRAVV